MNETKTGCVNCKYYYNGYCSKVGNCLGIEEKYSYADLGDYSKIADYSHIADYSEIDNYSSIQNYYNKKGEK